jgi:hypothetical protein
VSSFRAVYDSWEGTAALAIARADGIHYALQHGYVVAA